MSNLSKGRIIVGDDATAKNAEVLAAPPSYADNGLVTRAITQNTVFGEPITESYTTVLRGDFVYNAFRPAFLRVNNQAGGSSSIANSLLSCASGNTALGLSSISSSRPLKYRTGQGAYARFSTIFDTPKSGSVQATGVSNGETGLLVGYYFNTEFSCWRQYSGQRDVRTLTVTSGATSAGNVTITLEGVATSVAVTNTSSTTATAWEIAKGDYSTVNNVGWDAFAEGSTVVFVRRQANAVSGTFSFGAGTTGTAASMAQTLAGASVSNSLVTQSNFNLDTLDGNGPSGMVLDPTKGNIFQIQYNALSFGDMLLMIQDPSTSQWAPFHIFRYANANTIVNLTNPSITWSSSAYNYLGGSDNAVTLKSGGFACGIEGEKQFPSNTFSVNASKTALTAVRTPLLSIRLQQVYGGRLVLGELIARSMAAAVTTTKPVLIELVRNGTLNNTANFTSYSATESAVLRDTSATSCTGGSVKLSFTLGKDGQQFINLVGISELALTRFDTFTICATPLASNTDAYVSFGWFEDL